MATLALRCPTIDTNHKPVAGGHPYILFSRSPICLRELIEEKVRAELRKARAGGPKASSLTDLIGDHTHASEAYAVILAKRAFEYGVYDVVVDGVRKASLDDVIHLTRRTGIAFVVAERPSVTVVVDEFASMVEA